MSRRGWLGRLRHWWKQGRHEQAIRKDPEALIEYHVRGSRRPRSPRS